MLVLLLVLVSARPSAADWRQDIGTFHIGLSASDVKSVSPSDIEKIKSNYSGLLGVPVEIQVLRDYPALIDAHVSGRVDYAVYSATAYASAWLLCECVEPLVAPVLNNGASGIRSVLVMNASSTFTRLDLNGIKVGVPGKDSVSGFLIPLATYTIGSRSMSRSEPFFKTFDGMQATTEAFARGEIDGFFAWSEANAQGLVSGPGPFGDITPTSISLGEGFPETKLRWTSDLLRFGPHAVRRGISSELRALLLDHLQKLEPQELDLIGGLSRDNVGALTAVGQSDYELAIKVAKGGAEN